MGRKKKGAPVVIVRKDKKMHKLTHLAAFALTGGASSVVTATRAAQIAAYNARTRKLAAEADETGTDEIIAEASDSTLAEIARTGGPTLAELAMEVLTERENHRAAVERWQERENRAAAELWQADHDAAQHNPTLAELAGEVLATGTPEERVEFALPTAPDVVVGFVTGSAGSERVVFTRRSDFGVLAKMDGAKEVAEGIEFPVGKMAKAAAAYVRAREGD